MVDYLDAAPRAAELRDAAEHLRDAFSLTSVMSEQGWRDLDAAMAFIRQVQIARRDKPEQESGGATLHYHRNKDDQRS